MPESTSQFIRPIPCIKLLFAQLVWFLAAANVRAETAQDWLLDPEPYRAEVKVSADGRELSLQNGLIRRVWRLEPNGACIAFDNLMNGQSMLRAVRPGAQVHLDGVPFDVGGLIGQPNHAYLTPAWLDAMQADPKAMRLVGYEEGVPQQRFHWERTRHHAPNATWPPKGVYLRMDYEMPAFTDEQMEALLRGESSQEGPAGADNRRKSYAPPSEFGRTKLLSDDFTELQPEWTIHASTAHERSSFQNEGKVGEIYTPAHTAVYAQRALPEDVRLVETTLDVGTDQSASWGPGIALVWKDHTVKFHIRLQGNSYDGQPLFGLWDGQRENSKVQGRVPLKTEKPWTLRLRWTKQTVYCDARPQNGQWSQYAKVDLPAGLGNPQAVRIGKMDVQGGARDHSELGKLGRCRFLAFAAYGAIDRSGMEGLQARMQALQKVRVSVHYELYDGIPALSKWVTVHNDSDRQVTLDRIRCESLALVEHANWVETRNGVALPRPDYLHVETDFAFGGFNTANSSRHVVHWQSDPLYSTQVNYLRQTPCWLVVEPTYGPAQDIAAGQTFTSFRTYELAYEGDRERRSLAQRRMYRTIAPWVTENPLMHHMRLSDPQKVREAIDHAAEVGFEMIILSFGSGFNMESTDPAYIQQWKEIADYAHTRNIEIGGYSLLSSRRIGNGNDIVSPAGQRPTHGNCPALTSEWGQEYYRKLYAFFEATGFDLLEHDGPYPGDVDITPRPPLQKGEQDSRWVQWKIASDFYKWCREQGIYLNTPDYYYLVGSNKCGMGYREVNWSLPRAQQVIHTRQNIYDGTWTKTPSMGWMFVPLSQYHGGGAAATIEPLDEHRDHYEHMLASNLGLGVQACYRGPRLFDTDRTKDLVKKYVDWFKAYRDILESDVIHGRRADGKDLDWMLHVNPDLAHKGMLMVYNPLPLEVSRTIQVNLYYTGLTDVANVSHEGQAKKEVQLDRDDNIELNVKVKPQGMTWYLFQ